MGQEGPRQPHPNHQEEADKDETRIHSCRGSEKRDTEDHGGGEAPFRGKCAVMSHSGGSRKGVGSQEGELEKGHECYRGEHLGILERFQEGFRAQQGRGPTEV